MKWPTHLYLFCKIKANLRVNERRQKLVCWSVAHLIFFLHVCKNLSEFLIVQYLSCLISETFFPPGSAKGQIYNMLNYLVFFPFLSSGPSWQLPPHQCLQMAGTSTRGRVWAQQLTTWVSWAHSPDSLAVGSTGSWLGSPPFSFSQQWGATGGASKGRREVNGSFASSSRPIQERQRRSVPMKHFEHLARWRLFLWVY